jgi:hypothetical protein
MIRATLEAFIGALAILGALWTVGAALGMAALGYRMVCGC